MKPAILIIDDDPLYGEMTRQRLERAGYTVDFLESPFGSLGQMLSRSYDLLILDVNMPGMRGTSLAELVQKTRGLEQSKILFLSSMDPSHLQSLASQYRARGLSKSASNEQLVWAVRAMLS